MSKSKDYIPQVDSDFNDWQTNLINLIVANAVAWGITAGDVTALTGLQTIFKPLYTKFANKGTRTKADITAYRNARKAYEKAIRDFVKQWLSFNTLVTDEDRTEMAITIPDGARSARPAITDVPSVLVKNEKGAVEKLEFRKQSDASRPSVHPDANGVEIRYAVDKTVTTVNDCDQVSIISKATVRLPMPAEKAGKRVIGYARWINTSDPSKSGPWTPPFNGLISE